MSRILYALLAFATLTSCANSYNIQGSSNVSILDGRMLYLKVYNDGELKNVDSCEVVHGQFHFQGTVDSAKMTTLFMDDKSVMPVVLESGDITVRIDNTQQVVTGTTLNEKLFKFIDEYNKLDNQVVDLGHKQSQAIMDGEDEMVVNERLNKEAMQIAQKKDELQTSFIEENFENVLGPGVFFMLTAGYPYPELVREGLLRKGQAERGYHERNGRPADARGPADACYSGSAHAQPDGHANRFPHQLIEYGLTNS